jgi:predicted MPP superfamily phosphohydrolase
VLELAVDGLPAELDGLRIAHLSDFHLGVPSRGVRAVEHAVAWVEERRPDLVCVTGDLLSRPRGEPRLLALLERLGQPYVVLGNHDLAISRDPFSRPVHLGRLAHGTLLSDQSVLLRLRGRSVEIAGVDPRSWIDKRPSGFPASDADLRILLCHFPRVLDRVEAGRWNVILAGHLHAGQIVLPYGFGKLLLAHPNARHAAGIYRRGATAMHVSPGLGTTFVPFRLAARPEATELVLRCGHA